MTTRIKGKVKWFSVEKGYGFIQVPGRDSELFVHYSAILTTTHGRRNLEEGQEVEFEIGQGKKGEEAKDVEIL